MRYPDSGSLITKDVGRKATQKIASEQNIPNEIWFRRNKVFL